MLGEKTRSAGFNIGIAMAGAVSGGAYAAGVFDFLMEALDEWQKAKDRGENVPRHEVFISAVSGTSAGGITAAMGLASLAGGIRSVEEPSVNPSLNQPIRRALPELYDIWVKKVRLFDTPRQNAIPVAPQPATPALLDTSDIRPGAAPDSLLNSDVLTSIARDALGSIKASGRRLPFFTDPVHVFLTHTNLDGVPYPIKFTTGDAYTMLLHEGRAHFAVTGLGEREFPGECDWLMKWRDGGMPIDLRRLGTLERASNDGALNEPFETFAQAALTTSAFPFGFSARRVTIERAKMRSGALPFDPGKFCSDIEDVKLGFIPPTEVDQKAHFVCIDGGALNNEPFEIVRWAIRASNTDRNTRDSEKADRAVILIAPFPPNATVSKDTETKDRPIGIGFIGRALIPALINQARFKASDLIAATDPTVYSRFLVSPKPELASAPLYAFGGFLDEQFREHDFQLGRRNCQWFLRQHFTLSRKNPIFGVNPEPGFLAIADSEHPFDPEEWPIIPLVGTAAREVQPWGYGQGAAAQGLPATPVMQRRSLTDLRAALQRRCDLLVASYASQIFKGYPSLRAAAQLSWMRHRSRVVNDMMTLVDRQLQQSNQIEPVPKPTLFERLSDFLRSPAGILSVLFLLLVVAAILQIARY